VAVCERVFLVVRRYDLSVQNHQSKILDDRGARILKRKMVGSGVDGQTSRGLFVFFYKLERTNLANVFTHNLVFFVL
jgi:hypothetical protein